MRARVRRVATWLSSLVLQAGHVLPAHSDPDRAIRPRHRNIRAGRLCAARPPLPPRPEFRMLALPPRPARRTLNATAPSPGWRPGTIARAQAGDKAALAERCQKGPAAQPTQRDRRGPGAQI